MDPTAAVGGRYYSLHKSFRNAVRCLLTAVSREDVDAAFPSFTGAEREQLYKMLTNVFNSVHSNVQEEFDEECREQQVAAALDKIDDFIEEQNLDTLTSETNCIDEIEEKASWLKKDEIEYLTGLLKKAEENNNAMKARIEVLKKGEDSAAAIDALDKLKQHSSAFLNNIDG